MWYRRIYANIDQNVVQQWANRIEQVKQISDLDAQEQAISQLMQEFFDTSLTEEDFKYYDLIYIPLKELDREVDRAQRAITGEPDLDFNDVYSMKEWMDWKEKTTGLTQYDLPYLINNLDKSFSMYGGQVWPAWNSYNAQSRQPFPPEEAQFILDFKNELQQKAFHLLGVDKQQLSDPELWKVSAGESLVDGTSDLELVKHIDWRPNNDPDAEGTLLTFIAREAGVTIFAEVANPMPVSLQRQELSKFMQDLNSMPENWNREVIFVEGGDFEDILSGKLDQNIRVYRMMSDEEYNFWLRQEVIPVGKYFADKRQYAVGTDFADEGFKEVFSFIVNRALLSGMDVHVFTNDVPLKLEGRHLTPA